MHEKRWLIPLAFAAIYLIWGSTYLAIRFAIETMPPFLMVGVRFVIAGAPLYLWTRWRGETQPTAANWKATALMGGLLLLGGNGLVSWAELRVSSGLAALLVSTIPLFVVLLEWLGPRSMRVGRPTRLVAIGIAAGLAGIIILVGPGELLGEGVDPIGALVLVFAALSWAFGSALSRRLSLPASPLQGTAMQMLTGGAMSIGFGIVIGELSGLDLAAISLRSILALAYLIVFGSLLAFTAYVYLLHNVAVSKVSTYAYVNPVVALLLGWALAGEPLGPRTLIAGAVILGAVFLITTQRRSPGKAAVKPSEQTAEEPCTECDSGSEARPIARENCRSSA
jgi:drug/metabolite transporter (DMT)-like permease